ncbi:MAG: DUF1232 domain-containing protein [bacterium]
MKQRLLNFIDSLIKFVVHIPNFFKLYFRLLADPRVPFPTKIVPLGALIYLVSPYDLLPDFLMPLGWIEDIIIIYFAFRFLFRAAPQDVVREHVKRIDSGR